MNTKQIGSSTEHVKIQSHSNSIHNRQEEHPKSNEKKLGPNDQLSIGNQNQENFGTYKVDSKKLAQILQDFNKNTETFRQMVQTMIEKQGGNVNRVLQSLANGEEDTVSIKVDPETQAQAKEAISQDGYWGVDKTSERILEFAKTISGGDPSKIDTLVNAFKEGYEKAKEAFGGTLPEISQQTYDKVMEGFEAWKNE